MSDFRINSNKREKIFYGVYFVEDFFVVGAEYGVIAVLLRRYCGVIECYCGVIAA